MKAARLVAMVIAALFAVTAPAMAETRTICTLVAEAASGRVLFEEGDCGVRISPASTFKIAIAVMGYDAGILAGPDAPELPFREGYADWRPEWRQPATPAHWMRESVVWYSQQVTLRLGAERFAAYVAAFGYGNGDVSGDPGRGNGLTHAWLGASLEISPAEQVAFLRALIGHDLPVSAAAVAQTAALLDQGVQPAGWRVYGKTGTGIARDGQARFGWFVGWAERAGDTIVFARLIRDNERQPTPSGPRARAALLADLFADRATLDRLLPAP